MLERLAKDKHSSLSATLLDYIRENFYNIGPAGDKKKIAQFLEKVAKQLPSQEMPKYLHQRQILSPKHLHRTTFETLKYLQQTMLLNCLIK
jgi:hypothetical protein